MGALLIGNRQPATAEQRVLARLAQCGLVTMEPVGKRKHYRANPASPIYAELCGIAQKTVGRAGSCAPVLHPLECTPQLAYSYSMRALFVELPAFSRFRAEYLDDEGLRDLQNALMNNPEAGEVIEGSGGLRKLRHADPRRGKGKRGGLRVIYFWWQAGRQLWLFTLYDKDEMEDLSAKEKKALKDMLKRELEARQ